MRPVPSYIFLTFVFSYGVGFLTLWVSSAWLHHLPPPLAQFAGVSGVVFGPTFAALVVSGMTTGRRGVAELLAHLRPNGRALMWLIAAPAMSLAVALAACASAGIPYAVSAGALGGVWPLLSLHYLIGIFVVGIGEELGWRGWLLPTLLARRSRMEATLLVAGIWYVWHLPKLLAGATMAIAFAAFTFGLAFLFTALWSHTRGNVLVIAAAHAAVNAPWFYLEKGLGLSSARTAWFFATVLYAAAAVVLLAWRWEWWRGVPPATPPLPAARDVQPARDSGACPAGR